MEDLRLLGVSVYRTDEIAKPIEKLDQSKAITVDNSGSFFKKYMDVFMATTKEISTGKYDAVVVNAPGLISFLVGILCFIRGTPLIIRLIGDYWRVSDIMIQRSLSNTDIRLFLQTLTRLVLSKISFIFTDGFLVVSDNLVDVVERNTSIDKSNISIIHYPIDISEFSSGDCSDFIEQYQIDSDRVLSVVFHAEFYPKYRGFKDVIRHASRVLSDYPETCLVVAGWGEYYSKLSRNFDHDRIHFVGFIDDMPDLYATTDLLLYNSYMDGYPNVILEAQAAGVPVISNPKFGMREQINHLDTGILAQVDGQYENYLRDCLDGKIDTERLAQQARQSVQEHNTAESISRDLSCAVSEIIGDE